MTDQPLTVTYDDLQSRKVETRLKEQAALARNREYASMREETLPSEDVQASTARPSIWYNAVFTLAVFGVLGGLLAWGMATVLQFKPSAQAQAAELLDAINQYTLYDVISVEQLDPTTRAAIDVLYRKGRNNPYFQLATNKDLTQEQRDAEFARIRRDEAWKEFIANVLAYGVCGLLIALALSIAEPVIDRNVPSIVINGSVGATLGLLGGVVVALFVDRLYEKVGGGVGGQATTVRSILARSVTWGVMGLFLTIGPGLVMKNFKRLGIGLAGGLLGGLIGGALYDPVIQLTHRPELGRLVALVAIGGVAGVATGLIESASKGGWVRVIAGVISGKQFILYRNPTFIGSSPDCQIYLFKDKKVGRRHAAIHITKGGFEIEDLPLGASTLINGKPVKRTRLRHGDRVMVGSTCFLFQEKTEVG